MAGDRERLERDARAYVEAEFGDILNAEHKERMVQLLVERPSWHFARWRLAKAWEAIWREAYRTEGLEALSKRLARRFGASP